MKNKLNRLLAISTFLIGFCCVATAFYHEQQDVRGKNVGSLQANDYASSELTSTESATSDNENAKTQVLNYQSQLSNLLQSYLKKISTYASSG